MKLRMRIKRDTHEENMTPTDMSMLMKFKRKMSLFLWLHNEKTENWLLPNISISNMLRNDGDDDREKIMSGGAA